MRNSEQDPSLEEILAIFHAEPLGNVPKPHPQSKMGPPLNIICEKILYGNSGPSEGIGAKLSENIEPGFGQDVIEPLPADNELPFV